MRFDAALLQLDSWDTLREHARAAEDAGAGGIWIADHFSHPIQGRFWMSAWPTLGALAVETQRVHLGPLVSPATLHLQPAMLARDALTVERISAGRLELGLRSGHPERDYAMSGTTPWAPRERMDRFEEMVSLIDRLLRGGVVDHHGEHYHVTYADMAPGPVQQPRPPLVLAAQGRRGMRLVARLADGWNTLGGQPQEREEQPRPLAEAVAITKRQLDELALSCAELARDVKSIDRSVLAFRSPVDPLSSIDAFDEWVGHYADIGFAHFIFGVMTHEQMDVFHRALARPRGTVNRA